MINLIRRTYSKWRGVQMVVTGSLWALFGILFLLTHTFDSIDKLDLIPTAFGLLGMVTVWFGFNKMYKEVKDK